MKRFLTFVAIVALVVFLIYRWNEQRIPPPTFTPAGAPVVDLKDVPVLAAMDAEYTRLAEAVLPSVVSLTTSRKVQRIPFDFFFGPRFRGGEFVQNSLGSGVIVSEEGHILTNYHVVADMDEVKVHLRDGRVFPARIIGGDEVTDIAVLKIEASGIRPLPLGDSDQVKVGSLVLAIGNPFGLQETVTHGIISATGRQMSSESDVEFLQTDTAINPGNSGGPLINLRGEIIGINNAIGNYSGSGTWQGVGFAIPSNVAKRSMEAILKNGQVQRNGYLGVMIRQISPERSAQLGVSVRDGVEVVHVVPDSPAEEAGIKEGDLIVAFNGKPVGSMREFLRRVASVEVGSQVELRILRNGKEETVKATIRQQPEGYRSIPVPRPPVGTVPMPTIENGLKGVKVGPIPPGRLRDYPDNVSGVMVTAVAPDAPAAGALREGDVIEEINRQPVESVQTYNELLREIPPGRRIMLSIARGKIRSYVVITAQ